MRDFLLSSFWDDFFRRFSVVFPAVSGSFRQFAAVCGSLGRVGGRGGAGGGRGRLRHRAMQGFLSGFSTPCYLLTRCGGFIGYRLCRRPLRLETPVCQTPGLQAWLVAWLGGWSPVPIMFGSLWQPVAACGSLWQPVAACDSLWQPVAACGRIPCTNA